MNRAQKNQIIVSDPVKQAIEIKYECVSLGEIQLKGKSKPMSLYEITKKKPKE
jgi:class 3 adenylate cyclase